jgi:phage tail protein X
MTKITVTRPRTTLDLLLWRQFGIAGAALLEQVLQTNPGLADVGPVLPIGTIVTLPDYAPAVPAQPVKVIDLFGEG